MRVISGRSALFVLVSALVWSVGIPAPALSADREADPGTNLHGREGPPEVSARQALAGVSAKTIRQRIDKAVDIAFEQLGDPYVYGDEGPDSFDCSGLTYFSFRGAGFAGMPRTSRDQAAWLHRIPRARLKHGDFLFFYNGSGTVYHVAIYLFTKPDGEVRMLHAPSTGGRVERSTPWTNSWFPATIRPPKG